MRKAESVEHLAPACQALDRHSHTAAAGDTHSHLAPESQCLPSCMYKAKGPSTHLLLGSGGQAAQGLFTHWHWPTGQHHVTAGVQDCCTGVCQEQQVPSQMVEG